MVSVDVKQHYKQKKNVNSTDGTPPLPTLTPILLFACLYATGTIVGLVVIAVGFQLAHENPPYLDPAIVETFDNGTVLTRCHSQYRYSVTLRAPPSGTFLQTLPDLVTPLKGHSLSPRCCPATRSAPSERFGY